jgi:hypothetical protein
MSVLVDHPPLRAIARFLETPSVTVAPTYLEPTERATLMIATELEAVLGCASEDRNALPVLTPTLIQMAAMAAALTAQRLLPFPTPQDALQQFVGLMQQRVLANTYRDKTFVERSSLHHFLRASDHFDKIRRWITSPVNCPAELLHVRRELADFAVYLAFATYTSVRHVDDSENKLKGGFPGQRPG